MSGTVAHLRRMAFSKTRFGRTYSPPALPSPAGMSRPSPAPIVTRKPSKARRFFGAITAKANTGGDVVKTKGRAAAAALAREFRSEQTIGGIAARQAAPSGIAFGLGALDGSEMGQGFTNATGDLVQPSTAAFLGGVVLRATGVDQRLLGRRFTQTNTAMLNGMMPVKAYEAGKRAPEALRRLFAPSPKAAKVAGVGEAAPEKKAAPEPVPGEASVS